MVSLPERRRYSEAEYLALELTAATKHEYHRGEIIAMVGASMDHNQITINLSTLLHVRLAGGACRVFASDFRVRVSAFGDYSYPDVVVVCGKPRLGEMKPDTLINPAIIFEVLSPSTEAYDRGDKFAAYRTIETLQEYVLVSPAVLRVEQFTRMEGGLWRLREVAGREASLELSSVNCTLPLRDVYDLVEIET